jgi:hypothetical protein
VDTVREHHYMVDLISSKWCKIAVTYLLGVDESLIGNGSREMAVCLNVETGGGSKPWPLLARQMLCQVR